MTLSERLHHAGHVLAAEAARFASFGWMRGTSGNLSLVVEREPLRLAVTASGLDKGELAAHDVVLVDEHGRLADPAESRPASAEAGLHARIARITGAGAVYHVHTVASVVAGRREPNGVRLVDLEMLKGIGRRAHDDEVVVPVVENSQDMVELGDRVEAVLDRDVPAVIVARHGLYAWGPDAKRARHHLEVVEWLLEVHVAGFDHPRPASA